MLTTGGVLAEEEAGLRELEKLRAEKGKTVEPQYLPEYRYLLEGGARPEFLDEVYLYHLIPLKRMFEDGTVPLTYIPLLSHEDELMDGSKRGAERNSDFARGVKFVRKYIKKKLSKRKHVSRTSTDYEEGAEQLDRVENQHILFLLKGYVDYFESTKAMKEVAALFPEDSSDEQGGLFFFEGNSYRFVSFPNEREDSRDLRYSYATPLLIGYVPCVGGVHTHPAEDGEAVESVSGPSGWSRDYHEHNDGDTNSLRYYNQVNPYLVDIVITEMSENEYNIDAYFRDVYIKDGKAKNASSVTVIDLGIYRFEK
ncbi:MAG: hypothetical protein AAB719_02210 [Patescibacteria group bacterium]